MRSSWLINNACPNWYKVDINYFILSMNINFHTIFIHPVPCAKRASELNDVYEIYIPPWTKLLGYTGFGLSCTHWAWITQENFHYIDVTMTTMVSQITSLTVVRPGPVNSQHKGPVTRKMFPFDDVIMSQQGLLMG